MAKCAVEPSFTLCIVIPSLSPPLSLPMRNLYMSIKRLETSGRFILCFVFVGCMKVEQYAAKRTLDWIVKYISRVAEFLWKFQNMSQVFVDII